MQKQSLTITGLGLLFVTWLGVQANVQITGVELGDFWVTLLKLGQIAGFIVAYIGRMRRGDVKWFGGKK